MVVGVVANMDKLIGIFAARWHSCCYKSFRMTQGNKFYRFETAN